MTLFTENEDGFENTLQSTNYSFSLFFMAVFYFILKAAASSLPRRRSLAGTN